MEHNHGHGAHGHCSECGAPINRSNKLHVIFILDRSGSMGPVREDVIGGFNGYIEQLRKDKNGTEYSITYVRFDTEIETVWKDYALDAVPVMSQEQYQPRGSTALLDAVGDTLSQMHNRPADRFIVLVHTDGFENASHRWSTPQVRDLITAREKLGNWTFVYFGANQDAWAVGSQYMGHRGQTMSYDRRDTRIMYSAAGSATMAMASSGRGMSANFGGTTAAAMAGETDPEALEKMLAEDGDSNQDLAEAKQEEADTK